MNNCESKTNSKSLFVYIENITNRISKEQQRLIASLFSKAKDNQIPCDIQIKEIKNAIDDVILSNVNKRKLSLVLNDSKILFEFLINKPKEKDYDDGLMILFKDIIIFHYSKSCYHINTIFSHRHINICLNETIVNVFYDLSPKLSKSKTHIVFLTANYNLVKLSYYNNNTKSMLHYTSLHFQSNKPYRDHIVSLGKNNRCFTHYSFYEIDNFTFILFTIDSIFLFDKGITHSTLLHRINIAFSKYPFPILLNNNDLCFISSEQFIYQVNISSKQTTSLSLFGDLGLNFNNEKYKEMLELLKIILYYHLEIHHLSLNEITQITDNQLTLLFEQYDLHSYIENLTTIISEDNTAFFINYNLASSKLQAIIIYSFIYKNYILLNKLIRIISSNEANCLLFIVFIEDVIIDFFSLFDTSIDLKSKLKEVNKNLLSSISNRVISVDKLTNYSHCILK